MSRSSFTTLLVNLAAASLPVLTYIAADWILDCETRRPETETDPLPASDERGTTQEGGGDPTEEKDTPAPESRLVHATWLKLDTIETTQATSRLARPSKLVSGGPHTNGMSEGGLPERSAAQRMMLQRPAPDPQPRLDSLAPAIHAHAPPRHPS